MIYALETVSITSREVLKIRTGIAANFPKGFGMIIKDRSSMALKGFHVIGGVIDESYTGEISVLMTHICSTSAITVHIKKGDKIAQMIPTKTIDWNVIAVDKLDELERGNKGFGSSNITK